MAATDATELTLCEGSLREGLSARSAGVSARSSGDARRDAVCELVRRCGRDPGRGEHLARLAGQLFDALADVHGCSEAERELVEHAARLHDVGRFVSHKRFHKHTRYLVLQSRLAGFSDADQTVLAHIARYHRKAAPKQGQKKYSRLDDDSQERVRTLSALVRAAVALDRGHSEAVERVERAPGAEAEGPTFVSVHLRDEARVERAAFDRALLVVEKTFDRAIRPEYRIRDRSWG